MQSFVSDCEYTKFRRSLSHQVSGECKYEVKYDEPLHMAGLATAEDGSYLTLTSSTGCT